MWHWVFLHIPSCFSRPKVKVPLSDSISLIFLGFIYFSSGNTMFIQHHTKSVNECGRLISVYTGNECYLTYEEINTSAHDFYCTLSNN